MRFDERFSYEQRIHDKIKKLKWKGNSKYQPHQGKQECARRVRNGDIWLTNSRGGTKTMNTTAT